jgi:hypothetical protein
MFIYGALCGLGLQLYSDYKVKQIKHDATEKDFDVCQKQTFILFYDCDKSFDLCLESMEYVEKAKLKYADKLIGTVKAKTGMTWRTFCINIDFKVTKLTDYSSQIEVLTSPFVPITLVTYGEELKIITRISDFFSRKNDEKNQMLSAKQQQTAADETFSREKEFMNAKS